MKDLWEALNALHRAKTELVKTSPTNCTIENCYVQAAIFLTEAAIGLFVHDKEEK